MVLRPALCGAFQCEISLATHFATWGPKPNGINTNLNQ
jgi:hypothetical protein